MIPNTCYRRSYLVGTVCALSAVGQPFGKRMFVCEQETTQRLILRQRRPCLGGPASSRARPAWRRKGHLVATSTCWAHGNDGDDEKNKKCMETGAIAIVVGRKRTRSSMSVCRATSIW